MAPQVIPLSLVRMPKMSKNGQHSGSNALCGVVLTVWIGEVAKEADAGCSSSVDIYLHRCKGIGIHIYEHARM